MTYKTDDLVLIPKSYTGHYLWDSGLDGIILKPLKVICNIKSKKFGENGLLVEYMHVNYCILKEWVIKLCKA